MKSLTLRDYQAEAIDAVSDAWASGMKRPAVVLPTGMGKTVIFAEMIRRLSEAGSLPLVLVHRTELVHQAVDKIQSAAPGLKVGIIQAERHETDDVGAIVGSIATLGRPQRREALPPGIRHVIVDEAHHARAESFMSVLNHLGCFDLTHPARAVGFTATMERGDSLALGKVWEDIVYRRTVLYGMQHGYLVPVHGQTVRLPGLDLGQVQVRAGDYTDGSLADALERADAPRTTADAYWKYARRPDGSLRPGVLFAPTVGLARLFRNSFMAAGIPTALVHGGTPWEEREQVYSQVRSGKIKVIASCMVLTEGFDLPDLEVAVMLRRTTKAGLYIQMAGRVLRPAPWTQKESALILDISGVSEIHSLICADTLTGVDESQSRGSPPPSGREASHPLDNASKTDVADLFHASTSAWLQTYEGTRFIPTRAGYVFLWPTDDPDRYMVGRTHDQYRVKGPDGGWLVDGSLPIDRAMAWATQEAGDLDPSVSSRKASWRRKLTAPSPAQVQHMERLKIDVPDGMTKAQASDAISIHYASQLLDRTQ